MLSGALNNISSAHLPQRPVTGSLHSTSKSKVWTLEVALERSQLLLANVRLSQWHSPFESALDLCRSFARSCGSRAMSKDERNSRNIVRRPRSTRSESSDSRATAQEASDESHHLSVSSSSRRHSARARNSISRVYENLYLELMMIFVRSYWCWSATCSSPREMEIGQLATRRRSSCVTVGEMRLRLEATDTCVLVRRFFFQKTEPQDRSRRSHIARDVSRARTRGDMTTARAPIVASSCSPAQVGVVLRNSRAMMQFHLARSKLV